MVLQKSEYDLLWITIGKGSDDSWNRCDGLIVKALPWLLVWLQNSMKVMSLNIVISKSFFWGELSNSTSDTKGSEKRQWIFYDEIIDILAGISVSEKQCM